MCSLKRKVSGTTISWKLRYVGSLSRRFSSGIKVVYLKLKSDQSIMVTLSFHYFLILFLLFNGGFLVPSSGYTQQQLPRNALFVFGDSLYDAGMNNYINTSFLANFRPYGETFFNFPTGRFCDGRVIPDFVAEYGDIPLIQPYLQPGHVDFENGVNFASGGAGALTQTYEGYVVDLKTQLDYFKRVVRKMRKKHGDSETKAWLGRAVYLINIGGNDYAAYLFNNYTLLNVPYSQSEFLDMVFGNLTAALEGIYDKGGRKFGFMSIGPIGCSPSARIMVPGGACLEPLTDIAKAHNERFPSFLLKLGAQLKEFKFSHFNYFYTFSQMIKHPSDYGFKDGKSACCGSGPYRGIRSCGGKDYSTEFELCHDPSEYLFFDSYHPSEASYKQLAKMWWVGDSNTTWPCNLKSLF